MTRAHGVAIGTADRLVHRAAPRAGGRVQPLVRARPFPGHGEGRARGVRRRAVRRDPGVQGAAPADGRLFGDPAARFVPRGRVGAARASRPSGTSGSAREMQTIAAAGPAVPGPRPRAHRGLRWTWRGGRRRRGRRPRPRLRGRDRRRPTSARLPRLDAAAVAVGLRLERTIVSQAEPPPHELVLGLCSADPLADVRRLLAEPSAGVGFASPFLATVPGTDTYADDL